MLRAAVEAEAAGFIARHAEPKLSKGHQRVFRNGYLPERSIEAGVGGGKVKVPRVRDRSPEGAAITF